jgi:ribosome-associated protein
MDEQLEEAEQEYYAVRPNKTQIKRDIAVIHTLAEEIVDLSATQISELNLPLDIFDAAKTAAGMPQKGARKRQLKFLTGLLRNIDIEEVQGKLAKIKSQSALAAKEHHQIERWRDRLLSEGDQALSSLLQDYPNANRQQLRQLLRNANKETETGKPPKSARLIYQYLKELFAEE